MARVRSERRGRRVGIASYWLGRGLIMDSTPALTCSQHSVLFDIGSKGCDSPNWEERCLQLLGMQWWGKEGNLRLGTIQEGVVGR